MNYREEKTKAYSDKAKKEVRQLALISPGIVDSERGGLWRRLLRLDEVKAAHSRDGYHVLPQYDSMILKLMKLMMVGTCLHHDQELLQKHSDFTQHIRVDVPRLWPSHPLFRGHDGPGQQSLRNVLLVRITQHAFLYRIRS